MEAGDSDSYFKAGNDNMMKENYEDAIIHYDKAIELNPSLVSAWNNKGIALSRLKRFEDAIRCYDKAIGLDPNHANAWYNKAKAFRDMGQSRLDKANEDRTRAAKLINESLALFDFANECYDKGDAISKTHDKKY
jgi:tetratricopeptide (TPR) repeat protein